jgi:hypothetical protein
VEKVDLDLTIKFSFLHSFIFRIEGAFRLQAGAATYFEDLSFIKAYRPGLFHCSMQKEVLDMKQRMEVMRTVKDTSSKAGIKTALMIKKVSNDTQIIEENYELHRQFNQAVGECSMLSALREFELRLTDKLGGKELVHSKTVARVVINKFNQFAKIEYFHDNTKKVNYFDDAHKDAVDNMNRTLMSKILRKAVKQSDGKGVVAASLSLIPFFLNRDLKQNSKYAPLLLWSHIEFLRASSALKERFLEHISINTTGTKEGGIAWDMHNEHCILLVKKLLKALNIRSGLQADQAILDLGVSSKIVSNDAASLGVADKRPGTAYSYLTEENIEEMMEIYNKVQPFKETRTVIKFQQKMESLFEGEALSDANIKRFLKRNRENFYKSRLMRRNWKV